MKDDSISRHGVSAWLSNMGYDKLAKVVMDENSFPSAEPKLPGWAQKVEKYHEKSLKMPYIKKHRAWALYQAYKEYNGYGR